MRELLRKHDQGSRRAFSNDAQTPTHRRHADRGGRNEYVGDRIFQNHLSGWIECSFLELRDHLPTRTGNNDVGWAEITDVSVWDIVDDPLSRLTEKCSSR